jgi:hypothetical protein
MKILMIDSEWHLIDKEVVKKQDSADFRYTLDIIRKEYERGG